MALTHSLRSTRSAAGSYCCVARMYSHGLLHAHGQPASHRSITQTASDELRRCFLLERALCSGRRKTIRLVCKKDKFCHAHIAHHFNLQCSVKICLSFIHVLHPQVSDTRSAAAASLAIHFIHAALAHSRAGLRMFGCGCAPTTVARSLTLCRTLIHN